MNVPNNSKINNGVAKPVDERMVPPPVAKTRILAVDDDDDVLEVLNMYLKQEGYITEIARDGSQALKLLDDFNPDLLCIDFMMPGMDGQELARKIRSRKDLLYLPIIMLTASSKEEVKFNSLDSGVDAFLTKPVSRNELRATIRVLLRMKTAQDKQLALLERVAEVQDELLQFEREQGNYEAMRATVATAIHELSQPVKKASEAAAQLEKLIESVSETAGGISGDELTATGPALITWVRDSLLQISNVLYRMDQASNFTTKNLGKTNTQILDLDQTK